VKTVVAAFDLSPVGRRVVDRARLIAEEHGSRLTIVHVTEAVDACFLYEDQVTRLVEYHRQQAQAVAEWLRGRSEVPVELLNPTGSVVREVMRAARDADLIVSGNSSVDIEQVGPVTRRMARKAPGSLLTVRRQARGPYRRVVAAVDLSEASRAAVDLALLVAPDAEITLVYVLPSRFDAMLAEAGVPEEHLAAFRGSRIDEAANALEKFAAPWGERVEPSAMFGPPPQAISEMVRRRSADLVTVASRGRDADSMVLLGSVASEVIRLAPCDVAVARVPSVFRRPPGVRPVRVTSDASPEGTT
jgi:nucleotide-binding universal stress UspA family protein